MVVDRGMIFLSSQDKRKARLYDGDLQVRKREKGVLVTTLLECGGEDVELDNDAKMRWHSIQKSGPPGQI